MYAILNKKAERLKYVEKTEPDKQVPWWAQLFINLGFGILSSVFELVATSILGPVGGMIFGVVSEATSNIVADIITGNDPFAPQNIIFNIVLPVSNMHSRVKGIRRTHKNKVAMINEVDGSNQYDDLIKDLQNMGMDSIDDVEAYKRKYQKIMDKYPDIDLEQNFNDELVNLKASQVKKKNKIDNINSKIRKTTNIMKLIDPDYAVAKFVDFLTKPVKNKINKSLTRYFKKINTKFFKKTSKSIKRILIPLNHTKAPWIKGVKLIPVRNTINYFNVLIVFSPRLTNKKESIYIYNQKWTDIKKFLDAPSAGQYYINNIAWGWEIGKLIRNNQAGLKATKSLVNLFPSINKLLNSSMQLLVQIKKTVDLIVNKEELIESWENAHLAIIQGLTDGVKCTRLVKATIRTLQEHDSRYIVRFGSRKVQTFFNQKIRSFSPVAKKIKPYTERRK